MPTFADRINAAVGDRLSAAVANPALLRSSRREIFAALLAVLGAAAIAVGLVADAFSDTVGFGTKQVWSVSAGGVLGFGAIWAKYGLERRAEALQFMFVIAQVAVLYLVIRSYEIENRAFQQVIFPAVATGFFALNFLPANWRGWSFLVISLVSMFAILGAVGGAFVVVIGLLSIGICHLPIKMWYRIAVLAGLGVALAAVQSGTVEFPQLSAVLPILTSILMFRLVIYLYDLSTGKAPADPSLRLSYFFMLPNFAFPFFPVVDSATWARSYNSTPSMHTYQQGVMWVFIGLVHLLLYRANNYYLTMDPSEVRGYAEFLYYCFTNFGLYLKISGLFHLIIGCLFLFGFELPETHKRFYLSVSFIDLWRRINIYWKDFMQKTVFNPVFALARRKNMKQMDAIVIAVCTVFFATWVLHSYQWFWLRGTILLTVPDVLFWCILGLFVLIQTVAEARPPRTQTGPIIHPIVLTVVRTAATMTTLVILWSMWGSHTLAEWFLLLGRSGLSIADPLFDGSFSGWVSSLLFVGFLGLIVAISLGYTFGFHVRKTKAKRVAKKSTDGAWKIGTGILLASLAVTVIQTNSVYSTLPVAAQRVVVDLGSVRLSAKEQVDRERGYYENLTDERLVAGDIWRQDIQEKPVPLENTIVAVDVPDYRRYVLRPDTVIRFMGRTFTTNSHGMRDREYHTAKPDIALRFVLIGESRALGWGIGDDETFENELEDSLTERFGQKVEILNLAVPGYDPFEKVIHLDEAVRKFDPDAVIYIAHAKELRIRSEAANAIKIGPHPGKYLEQAIDLSGAKPEMSTAELTELFNRHPEILVDAAYSEVAEIASHAQIDIFWVYLPTVTAQHTQIPELESLMGLAKRNGFHTVDLRDIFDDHADRIENLWVSPIDDHPNAQAHQRIAEVLEEKLIALTSFSALFGADSQ